MWLWFSFSQSGRETEEHNGGLVQLNGWMVVTGADFWWIFLNSCREHSFEPLTAGQKIIIIIIIILKKIEKIKGSG
jgi:hypothetical protein